MTTRVTTPYRPQVTTERESFWHLVHAELIKFRSVRGWVITMIAAILAITASVFVASSVSSSCSGSACAAQPAGPGGEPVTDAFYFAHQPLTGNGTITVQLTSLAGQVGVSQGGNGQPQMEPGALQPWSKAGIIIKENTSPGSAYAAMMVTGSHGVRLQWDYVNDTPGLTGSVSAPRWLRLVRDGDTITGYDSADGTRWTLVGTAALPGLTSTVQGGLFAAAPGNGSVIATGVFRHIGLSWPATRWTGTNVSGVENVSVPGSLRQSDGTLTVTGSGDISPLAGDGAVLSLQRALDGTFLGLIAVIVVGAMFMTAEYRRGLIRVSLAASPRRGRFLAAKAVAIGGVSFVTGLIAASLTVALGARTLARTGVPLWPVPALTQARLVAVIVLIFVPYLLALVPPIVTGLGHSQGGGLSLVAR